MTAAGVDGSASATNGPATMPTSEARTGAGVQNSVTFHRGPAPRGSVGGRGAGGASLISSPGGAGAHTPAAGPASVPAPPPSPSLTTSADATSAPDAAAVTRGSVDTRTATGQRAAVAAPAAPPPPAPGGDGGGTAGNQAPRPATGSAAV